MRTFSLGVLITSSFGAEGVDPGSLPDLATGITTLGVDALFVASSARSAVEPVTAVAAIAMTHELVLGAVISLESKRNPAIVAKMATTLAVLAPGRSALIFENDRGGDTAKLREAVQVAASLRQDGPVNAGGAEFFVRDAYNEPRPAATDALAIGVIVDRPTPGLATACDLVLARSDADVAIGRHESAVVPLVREESRTAELTRLVVEVDGNSVDHVLDVVARVARQRLVD